MSIQLNGSSGIVGAINSMGALTTTTGSAVDFNGIPPGVKRVTIVLNGVSLASTSHILVQIGGGSLTTTGYVGSWGYISGSATYNVTYTTAGFGVWRNSASDIGSAVMTLVNVGGNTWVAEHSGGFTNGASYFANHGGGNVTLTGTLDRVRITTVVGGSTTTGTDSFDAGSVNVFYE